MFFFFNFFFVCFFVRYFIPNKFLNFFELFFSQYMRKGFLIGNRFFASWSKRLLTEVKEIEKTNSKSKIAAKHKFSEIKPLGNTKSKSSKSSNEKVSRSPRSAARLNGLYTTDAEPAQVNEISSRFAQSKRRLIILDYGGTLVEREKPTQYVKREFTGVSGKKLEPSTLDVLHGLSSDLRNEVYVVSGISRGRLEEILEPSIDNTKVTKKTNDVEKNEEIKNIRRAKRLGMIASGGISISKPVGLVTPKIYFKNNVSPVSSPLLMSHDHKIERNCSSRSDRQWVEETYEGVEGGQAAWQLVAREIMDKYTWRVNGATVRLQGEGRHSIVWDWRRADPEWGGAIADVLCEVLEKRFSEVTGLDVQVVRLSGQVLVQPRRLGKGHVVRRLLRSYAEDCHECSTVVSPKTKLEMQNQKGVNDIFSQKFDFVMVIGDDGADEEMYHSLFDHVASSNTRQQKTGIAIEDDAYLFTVTVGMKVTAASLYVSGPMQVTSLLESMVSRSRESSN